MSKFVRSSKFRHVFGQAAKPEESYNNIKLTKNAWDSNYIAVNPQYLAICWQTGGGGAVGVVPLKKTGKLGDGDVGLFSGHKGPVLDIAFSPFNDNILATSSEDCTVKIWQIPEGGLVKDQTDAVQVLSGHGRKAGTVNFNPVANNILATSALDYKVKLWDIETGDEKFNVDGHTNIIQSVDWNANGSLMTTFCKDKKIRVLDPRSSSVAQEREAHEGVKGGRACWLNDGKLLSVGFSKTAERRFAIWDSRNLKDAITDQGIDNAAGIIMPFFDSATNVLFLAGKGDGTIRYYEIVDDNKAIYFLSSYSSNQPQAGMAALPKRGVNVSTNEIMRLYKAQASIVEPISFTVPRKSDIFQDDLFPDCPSEEPALTAAEWSSGKTSEPKTRSMAPGFVAKPAAASTSFTKKEESSASTMSADQLQAEYEKLKARVSYLEAEIVKKDALIKDLQNK
eukprot:TRINITY_DN11535_c2_g1_i1.p1 TRINITY_DN11535_c2_g1~~TRINITY_DN11535_c2_g1_i1.p1  ORF type:complete len:471 (-),score=169.47 TRINITY_DN11535_c2_g1_i1:127-1482(-)